MKIRVSSFITRITRAALAGAIISCVLVALGVADYEDIGVGARLRGMGGVGVGLVDDVYSIAQNPAGLGFVRRSELAAEYERMYIGLSDNSTLYSGFMGYVLPWNRAITVTKTVEESSATVKTERVVTRKNMGAFGVGWQNFGLSGAYAENIFSFGWGRRMFQRWTFGTAVKLLTQRYTMDEYTAIDPVFSYGGATGTNAFSADIGALYNVAPRIFAGLVLRDINQPDIGLAQTEKLPMTTALGLGYRRTDTAMGCDLSRRDEAVRVGLGAETWLFRRLLGVRGGISFGSHNMRAISFGISCDVKVFRVDYGVRLPMAGIEDTGGSHRMSIVCRFGMPDASEVEPGSVEAKLLQLETEHEELTLKLRDAVAMKERMEQVLIEEAMLRVKEKITAAEKSLAAAHAVRKSVSGQSTDTEGSSLADSGGMRMHVVKRGETLKSIATLYYKNARKWMVIYNENKASIGRGGNVTPGQVLVIPMLDEPLSERPQVPAQSPKQNVQSVSQTSAVQPSFPSVERTLPQRAVETNLPEHAVAPIQTTRELVQPHKPSASAKTGNTAAVPSQPTARPKTHIVKAGETLKSIAELYYQDSQRWKDIYAANKDKVPMGRVSEGTKLVLP